MAYTVIHGKVVNSRTLKKRYGRIPFGLAISNDSETLQKRKQETKLVDKGRYMGLAIGAQILSLALIKKWNSVMQKLL